MSESKNDRTRNDDAKTVSLERRPRVVMPQSYFDVFTEQKLHHHFDTPGRQIQVDIDSGILCL